MACDGVPRLKGAIRLSVGACTCELILVQVVCWAELGEDDASKEKKASAKRAQYQVRRGEVIGAPPKQAMYPTRRTLGLQAQNVYTPDLRYNPSNRVTSASKLPRLA